MPAKKHNTNHPILIKVLANYIFVHVGLIRGYVKIHILAECNKNGNYLKYIIAFGA